MRAGRAQTHTLLAGDMAANTTAPAAHTMWINVGAVRGAVPVLDSGLPAIGVQPAHVTAWCGNAGIYTVVGCVREHNAHWCSRGRTKVSCWVDLDLPVGEKCSWWRLPWTATTPVNQKLKRQTLKLL